MKYKTLPLLFFLLAGCGGQVKEQYKGEWNTINASNVLTSLGSLTPSFNTSMYMRYFIEDKVEDKQKLLSEVTSIYDETISDLHKKFDRHYDYVLDDGSYVSNLKKVNASLNKGSVKVSKETFDLLKMGVEYTKFTDGYFNIFVGDVVDFWDEIFNDAYNFSDISKDPYFNKSQEELLEKLTYNIPSPQEVDEVLKFNEETLEVTFSSVKTRTYKGEPLEDLSISLGGIAKGFATDIAKDRLLEKGYDKGYLFSGGSSIASLAKPIYNNGKGQKITVVDPRTAKNFGNSKVAFGIYFPEEFAMSTSGNYTLGKSYSFYQDESKESLIHRHHIINPFTGYPMENFASVTLVSNDLNAGQLDVFSTAFMNLDIQGGLALKEKIKNNLNKDLEAIYIEHDELKETINIISTSSFSGNLEVSKESGVDYQNA